MRLVPFDNASILGFVRQNDEEAYLVVESLADDDEEASAQTPDVTTPGTVVWGAADVHVDAAGVHVKVPATGSAVVKLR
jgi:hypothetical protein